MTVAGSIEGKMAVVLKELTMALSEYLGRVLPKLAPDRWWQDAVLANLTHNQQQRLRQVGGRELLSLDLAALLRVFDANWWDLSNRESLSPDCRHYLKELQSVRNRWAHAGAAPEERETVYRDLDTVQRLLVGIAPEHHLIDALSGLKAEVLGVSRGAFQ